MNHPDSPAPSFATIQVDASTRIGRLTLNRPAKRNPLSTETLGELVTAANWFNTQSHVAVVVVSGNGPSFCAGADIGAFVNPPDTFLSTRDQVDLGRRMADAVEAMRAVTVVAIHGHCVGGGVVLAAACDLRVAADDTYFSIPEIDLGIPLAWGGLPRLMREFGPAVAKELVMTCRPFSAAEAHQHGFVNRVVPADAVLASATELAETLAAKAAVTIANTKARAAAVSAKGDGNEDSWNEADGYLVALQDPEARAAAARYLESLKK